MNAVASDENVTSSASVASAQAGLPHPPPPAPAEKPAPENPAKAAFRAVPELIGELKAYTSHYVTARIDALKLTARNVAIYAGLGVLGLIVMGGVIVSAVALMLSGLAHGLGVLMWHQMWLGDLTVGVLILGVIALAIYRIISRLNNASRKQTEQKYEGRRIQQRVKFGRDVHERAALRPESSQPRPR